ncbi:MAG TPA: isochorismatase, partial [Ramlibacter sp.]|nr:isochorismatase [Ramlibacter sp.]
MLLDVDESQLLLVDYQERLMPSIHEREAVLLNAVRLGRMARMLGVPTWGTEENPTRLGPNPPELRALCGKTLEKMHFSACADGLAELLRAPARPVPGGNARSLPKH